MGKLTTKAQGKAVETRLFQGQAISGEQATPIIGEKNKPSGPADSKSKSADPDATGPSSHGGPAITTTAKPKARQHQPDPRERRRIVKNRRENFEAATRFAHQIGLPINVAVTINWTALIQAGERN